MQKKEGEEKDKKKTLASFLHNASRHTLPMFPLAIWNVLERRMLAQLLVRPFSLSQPSIAHKGNSRAAQLFLFEDGSESPTRHKRRRVLEEYTSTAFHLNQSWTSFSCPHLEPASFRDVLDTLKRLVFLSIHV